MATPSEKHEIHCAKRYLEYTETPFYRAFRDRENPESFDSNYAVLKRMEEAEQSLAAVESYYEGLDVTPKFYSKPDSVTLEESRAFFEAHGYAVHTFECQRMMLLTHTSPELLVHKCPVQIFAGAPLTGAAAQLVTESCGEKDFGLRLIDKQLGAGARVSFAYNRAEIPVSFCVGEGYGSAFICRTYIRPKISAARATRPRRCWRCWALHATRIWGIPTCSSTPTTRRPSVCTRSWASAVRRCGNTARSRAACPIFTPKRRSKSMALHVSPEIREQYHGFYSLALDGTTDDGCALVLENVPAAGLRAALEAVPEPDALRTVLIKSCPELQSLSFLENFPALEWVYVRRCPAVAALWDTARTPALRGLAVTDCKKLRDISGLDGAAALEHLFLQYSAWSAVKLESLAPLRGLCALRTLDLGCRGAKDKVKLDFNMLYPQLDSLTITPSLKEYFITNTEAGR